MERSVFSDRMVFVRTVQESGWMGDVELAVYDSWFDPILNSQPSLLPDGFIYLRAEPPVCMDRWVGGGGGGWWWVVVGGGGGWWWVTAVPAVQACACTVLRLLCTVAHTRQQVPGTPGA
jgi:hypothetical protein